MDSITNGISRVFVPRSGEIASGDVVGQPLDQARTKLEAAKIVVDKVEPHDPKNAGRDLVRFTTAPTHLAEGTHVNLVTRDGKVLYYTLASEDPGSVQDLRDEVNATRAVVTETRNTLDQALPQIEGLKAQIETNKTDLAQSRSQLDQALPQIEKLGTAIESNKKELANTQPQIQELRAKVDAAASETRVAVDGNVALRDQVTTLKAQLLDAQQKHDRDLAATSAELGAQVNSLKTQLVEAQRTHDAEVTSLRTALKTATDDLQNQIRRIRPNP
jgi:chromosome segregation ATPase